MPLHLSLLLLLTAALVPAAVRWTPSGASAPLHRTDFKNIQFKLSQSTAQQLAAGGDPTPAIQAALDSWNALPNTALHFAPLGATTAGIALDNQNVIAFADTDAARQEVGALVAVTHVSFTPDGSIVETDIILNPAATFSTNLQPGTYDLQAVITHELGHALGSNHATVASATMFWMTPVQSNLQAQLQPDDAAFAADVYPSPAASAYGVLTGTVPKGAGIIAINPDTGVTIGGLSDTTNGSFSLRVPAGNYLLFAEPIAPLIPPAAMYGIPADQIDISFKAAVSGTTYSVAAGATVTATVAVVGEASALAIEGYSGTFGLPVVQAGKSLDFIVVGPGLDSTITEQNLTLIGPATIHPGTLKYDTNITFQNGRSPLRFTVDASTVAQTSAQVRSVASACDWRAVGQTIAFCGLSPRASGPRKVPEKGRGPLEDSRREVAFSTPPETRWKAGPAAVQAASGSAISLFIAKGQDTALLAGGILILPPKPYFTTASLVDAASSKGAGVAPGELVSMYGLNLGPTPAAVSTALDPATGALPTSLGGVSVTFDGIQAPMLLSSPGQINLQVPYELAGKGNTAVVVTNQGTASDPVTMPVLTAQPGIFVVVNQDGTVNSQANPAPTGTYVTIYATGAGVVDPPVPTGVPAPLSPLSFARGVSVSIGGTNAVVYQGGVLSPTFVGLLQVAAQIPATAAAGPQPGVLSAAGQSSPAATVVVK